MSGTRHATCSLKGGRTCVPYQIVQESERRQERGGSTQRRASRRAGNDKYVEVQREVPSRTLVHRVSGPSVGPNAARAYLDIGGGRALASARRLGPAATIDEVLAAGVRGRGGGGFPTGQKWSTVAANRSAAHPSTVVVNASEGEPGSFKDRELLLRNPYRTLEGALVAASAIGADRVIVGMKKSFTDVATRVRCAIEELDDAGWTSFATITVFEGPSEYLLGEETALLESIDGRHPFPRVGRRTVVASARPMPWRPADQPESSSAARINSRARHQSHWDRPVW